MKRFFSRHRKLLLWLASDLALLLLFHLLKTEHNLLRRQGLVKQHPHIDPAQLIPKLAEKISSKISYPLLDQPADILCGKALLELLERICLYNLADYLEQIFIFPKGRDAGAHII